MISSSYDNLYKSVDLSNIFKETSGSILSLEYFIAFSNQSKLFENLEITPKQIQFISLSFLSHLFYKLDQNFCQQYHLVPWGPSVDTSQIPCWTWSQQYLVCHPTSKLNLKLAPVVGKRYKLASQSHPKKDQKNP